jgi:hypothetical protein
MIICGSLSPQILIPWVGSLEKEAFKQLLKAEVFEDARLKALKFKFLNFVVQSSAIKIVLVFPVPENKYSLLCLNFEKILILAI